MDPLIFAAASAALLAAPGPTNTLLATSGAAIGVRRSLPLLGAEIAGYGLSIAVLQVMLGPIIGALPAVEIALRMAVALYLVHLAVRLWRQGSAELDSSRPVGFIHVLVTTLLNPKGLVIAFTLLPQGMPLPALLPWMAVLSLMILATGGFWIVAGASLGRGFAGVVSARTGFRAGAVALLVLAGVVGAHALN